jgi:tRNA pseudouridine55 synthase
MMDGIFNIYKEKGFTSHDVVAIVRRTIHMKKVGHTGTLDPDAEGVLPVCVGKATKLSDVIMDGRKSYRAMLRLGMTTTTEDASGEVLETKEVDFNEDRIREVVASFIGKLEQVPPMYSAVKVNGKKLYELAREGKEIERKSRTIEVYDIRIRQFLPPDRVEIDVDCSKGTYIRTLCSDIGKALGCGGHMAELLRTRTGAFSLENAIKLDELKALAEQEKVETVLLTMEEALEDFPVVKVSEKSQKFLYNGGKIQERFLTEKPAVLTEGEIVATYDYENNLVGLYELIKDENSFLIKPYKMLIKE